MVVWGQFQEPVRRKKRPNSVRAATDERVNQIFHSEIKINQ